MDEYMDPGVLQPVTPTNLPEGVQAYLWPEISATVSWIAFVVAILIYFIGYFSGGKENRPKIMITLIVASVIGFLGRGTLNPVLIFLVMSLNFSPRYAEVIVSSGWMIIVLGVAIFLYETLIVTAKEARLD